jgi:hypothetical protein
VRNVGASLLQIEGGAPKPWRQVVVAQSTLRRALAVQRCDARVLPEEVDIQLHRGGAVNGVDVRELQHLDRHVHTHRALAAEVRAWALLPV